MNESTALMARNAKIMMAAQIVTWSCSFVLMSFMPRYLGAEEFGKLVFGISISAFGGLLMDLGLTMLVVKEVARDKSTVSRLFLNGGILRVFAWAASLALMLLFVVLSDYPVKTIEIVLILGVANIFLGLYELIHRFFIGLERLEYRSYALVSEKVFLAVVGVTMLILGFGAITIALVMLLSMALNFVVSFYFLRRFVPIKFHEIEPATWPGLLKSGFPYMIAIVFGFISYRVDVVMLSSMTNDAVVGWYGAPYRLFDTLMFFPVILNTAVFPVLSRLFHTSKDNVNATSRKLLDLTIMVAVPLAVGMSSLAQPIVSFLFGLKEFSNSVILLQLLSASLLLVYVSFVLNTVLISYNKQNQASWIAPIATVINVTGNYFAIPYFQVHFGNGAIGAAITTGITEAVALSLSFYLIPKGCFGRENLWLALKTLLAGGLMAYTILAVGQFTGLWVIDAILGCAIFVSMLFVLKVISKNEVMLFMNLLPFRRGSDSISN